MFNLDINLFSYISVRAFLAFLLSFIITLIIMPLFISWAKSVGANQPILSDAPLNHQKKSNTPTMGGVVFICAALLSSLVFTTFNVYSFSAILCIVCFGAIGIIDDLGKVLKKANKAGLKPRSKMILMLIASLITILPIMIYGNFSTELFVPFYKYPIIDMKYFALLFWVLVLISSSNAINLTDGLDGLACVPSVFSLFTLSVFLYLSSNAVYANYLLLPRVSGSEECVVIALALIGALLGFLWYNCHPAQVFMGDSGSLTLGAIVGYLAIISKNEILLILIGFVFVLETISVILQVGSFKIFHKRIFKMAPIHHHFEQIGWSENKIIVRFWLIAFICNVLALITIKLR
ncbi:MULTISPECIES: phospho-N-acetylmuramoyl-pentapeptide-transferase [unclassified Campylobacter]|uniref:phospho-N-acetylmuramoyl-pentapeptide- transferase n=1 Tax=unclassified Campylobacter TaxID=2593542 RepID=UPI001BD92993|nr:MULTISPECIES: phospho-N-acetylmuramoyl-pentapeptide-transferase [unclassified Campylobacter]MBZ7976271.1 phospho-N-acetylmuramoyl-pentapeptide-transferase [Campylobacter sp. RM12637]MBZ7977720.1 phospho-N-acetylmuramoyl-pentapeptide-transferase [Campylobacter sp. RM12654]MBZ7979653.1 phospho-N-acetylmuramoyl-pentapeptide-transferase [Campylobacter sp. RM12642]MBZ7981582.1 phospho-N-acetylmuramoyl-pentapeptide-transferase [Campylobacter sp. RM12640]MBZ7983695.1 phospho-N-acetylmuramoyl-penta